MRARHSEGGFRLVRVMAYRSIVTIRADAVRRFFGASGRGINVAVFGTGIDASHPHFRRHQNLNIPLPLTHRDFTQFEGEIDPLKDPHGFGTQIAGIIGGELSAADMPISAQEEVQQADGTSRTEETQVEAISGVAPECKLISYKVLDNRGTGPVGKLVSALREVARVNESRMLIHVVCLPVGYPFEPKAFACGQSPLSLETNRLVRSGVVVVVSSGNTGYGIISSFGGSSPAGIDMSINDPGNAELAITVGSTHRDLPHLYGVSYFSSKGPTVDGRLKPDLLAPGEKIVCCALGDHSAAAQYRESSGTSIAAAHAAGAVACLLSVRRDLIGQPEKVKEILLNSAVNLGRVATHQGRGLIDLLQAVQPSQAAAGMPVATTAALYQTPASASSFSPAYTARTYSSGSIVVPPAPESGRSALRLMYSYSRSDDKLKEELDAYLAPLVREGLVTIWSDRAIVAGSPWEKEILDSLEAADIIILLVSAHFMKSDYCWSKEMTRAVQRHLEGSARVVPVIVSHADWEKAPFAQLQALPKDAIPISSWQDQSEGWTNVAKGIRSVVEVLRAKRTSTPN